MTVEIVALHIDAHDPVALARFWAGVLRRETVGDTADDVALRPDGDTEFLIRFDRTEARSGDRTRPTSTSRARSPQEQAATVEQGLETARRHLDVGQLPEEEHVVLADPEGNEFCVIEAGNGFLEGTGRIGACRATARWRRPVLERSAGLAAGLGPGRGDRDPVAARRHEDLVGRTAAGAEVRHEAPALDVAPPAGGDRRRGGRAPHRPGRDPARRRRARSPGWCWPTPTATSSRVLPAGGAG